MPWPVLLPLPEASQTPEDTVEVVAYWYDHPSLPLSVTVPPPDQELPLPPPANEYQPLPEYDQSAFPYSELPPLPDVAVQSPLDPSSDNVVY